MPEQSAGAFPASLLLVGAGKMGGALLEGWLNLGLDPHHVNIIDPAADARMIALCQEKGIAFGAPAATPEALVLAIKPQMLEAAASEVLPLAGKATLILSILAGKTLANLEARFGHGKAIVRAMPNLPASIGYGVTGCIANKAVSQTQQRMADALLAAVGSVEWLPDENLIDALTAISGCGPAYVFYLTECLTEAGIETGLPADLSARLARATVEGSGQLLANNPAPPDELRRNVTSPNGVTAAALDVLMSSDGLLPLLKRTALAAKRRAGELAG
jgi:pyrroline-5-carboxylate reductase